MKTKARTGVVRPKKNRPEATPSSTNTTPAPHAWSSGHTWFYNDLRSTGQHWLHPLLSSLFLSLPTPPPAQRLRLCMTQPCHAAWPPRLPFEISRSFHESETPGFCLPTSQGWCQALLPAGAVYGPPWTWGSSSLDIPA